jgi:hypothetical protein
VRKSNSSLQDAAICKTSLDYENGRGLACVYMCTLPQNLGSKKHRREKPAWGGKAFLIYLNPTGP